MSTIYRMLYNIEQRGYRMDKKELKDMSDAELLEELERLNSVVDDMFDDEEEDK